jgi:cell division protein FtsZ
MIHFDLPKEKSSIIKVIGVGGGGGNAINHMFSQHIDGVNFVICNTDAQALASSGIPNRVQLGPHLTQGLGAGANPEIGRQATEESLEEIRRILEVNTKMAFITAGMGGGTGTGGAPIIAKICKDLGILTVGIVTTPFAYEGKKRQLQAEEGIRALRQHVDTLLVISNDKLRHQFGNLKMREAFEKADNVLATAAKCITDVINSTGQINVDFADVCTVMRNGGVAFLGSAMATGENRAQVAIEEALNSPLLNDSDIRGAKWILININSAHGEHEFTVDEVEVIQQYLLEQAGPNTDVILGMGYDETLGNNIGITLIATGFEQKDPFQKATPKTTTVENKEEEKIVMVLGQPEESVAQPTVALAPVVNEPVQTTSPIVEESAAVIESVISEEPVVISEHLIPTLIEETPEVVEEVTPAAIEPVTIHFELQTEESSTIAEVDAAFIAPAQPTTDSALQSAVPAGGYLTRPANIYAETTPTVAPVVAEVKAPAVAVVQPAEMPSSTVSAIPGPTQRPAPVVEEQEELLELQMKLVEREEMPEEIPAPVQVSPNLFREELPIDSIDEEEDQQRRAAERLHKLRNLSFNVNSADPNNEFETVPAYIRRNMELYNSNSQIENFYSSTEVKADDNSLGKLSDFNKFLDGKKPD